MPQRPGRAADGPRLSLVRSCSRRKVRAAQGLPDRSADRRARSLIRTPTGAGSGAVSGPQPDGSRRRLHRAHEGGRHGRSELLHVDLIADADREACDLSGRVVAGPVEAPIDDGLDPAPGGGEPRGDDERRGSHGQAVAPGQRRQDDLQPEDQSQERQPKDAGQDRPADGAADEPVDVVEAVAQDCDAGGNGDE